MEIKDIIRKKRLERGYTMKELAEKVGVSEATVSRWESGNLAIMKHTKIMLLSEALGISPAMLFDAPAPLLSLTDKEANLIKKYRELSEARRYVVDEILDVQYQKQIDDDSAKKGEQRLG